MQDVAACVPNIGSRQRRYRLLGGLFMSLITAVAAAWSIAVDAPWFWRLLVALPAGAAALGVFQAQAHTCVALARQGLQNMDAGNENVASGADHQRHRSQARQVYLRTLLATIAVAVATLAL